MAALVESVVSDLGSDDVGAFIGDEAIDIVEEWIPSTNLAINYAIGDPRKGAFPQGKIIEIFGPKSSAKSLILYDAGINVQKMGGIFVLIDSESSFSKPFGTYLGIDYSKFIYAHLRTIEEVTDFVEAITEKIRRKDKDCPVLIGWDSLAACTTLTEIERDEEDGKSEMGDRAKLMSRQMRKLGTYLSDENITYIVINQIRKKIGVMFGNPNTTPGGEALPFFASVRITVTKTKKKYRKVAGKKRAIGHGVRVFAEKNKVRPPFGECNIDVYVDKVKMRYGLDVGSGLLDVLVADEILKVSGNSAILVADPSIKFPKRRLVKHWDTILEHIPEDLYKSPHIDVEE